MNHKERIAIASDHAGLSLKRQTMELLKGEMGLEVEDMGAFSDESVDYPDFGMLVARSVSEGAVARGILICGTGIGMSIIANKFNGVRAALCHNEDMARLSREHNNANVLVMGARMTDAATAANIVRTWFNTPFEGGRHERRIQKIREIEKQTPNEQS